MINSPLCKNFTDRSILSVMLCAKLWCNMQTIGFYTLQWMLFEHNWLVHPLENLFDIDDNSAFLCCFALYIISAYYCFYYYYYYYWSINWLSDLYALKLKTIGVEVCTLYIWRKVRHFMECTMANIKLRQSMWDAKSLNIEYESRLSLSKHDLDFPKGKKRLITGREIWCNIG